MRWFTFKFKKVRVARKSPCNFIVSSTHSADKSLGARDIKINSPVPVLRNLQLWS